MTELQIDTKNRDAVVASFEAIAKRLFNDYRLVVNGNYYRLLDIEFYYYCSEVFPDMYAHKHEAQLQSGKWYFHASGIDITIGNGKDHGGILIRAIAKISQKIGPERQFIEKEVHGPINVKTEVCSHLKGPFEEGANIFRLEEISGDEPAAAMAKPDYVIRSRRIGLNPNNDDGLQEFCNGLFRFVIFPHLKLKAKTQLAKDMQKQFPDMDISKINKALGSTFLKEPITKS